MSKVDNYLVFVRLWIKVKAVTGISYCFNFVNTYA